MPFSEMKEVEHNYFRNCLLINLNAWCMHIITLPKKTRNVFPQTIHLCIILPTAPYSFVQGKQCKALCFNMFYWNKIAFNYQSLYSFTLTRTYCFLFSFPKKWYNNTTYRFFEVHHYRLCRIY